MAPTTPLAIAVAAAGLALAGFAVWGLASELPGFWDPCREWGAPRQGGHTLTLSPGDGCPARSATSETKAEAVVRLALVDGLALAGSGLAVAAAWRRRAGPAFAAAVVLLAATVVLFFGLSAAFLAVLPVALLDLVAANRWRRRKGA